MKKNLFSRIVAGVGALALVATMMPGLSMTAKAAQGALNDLNIESASAKLIADADLANGSTGGTGASTVTFKDGSTPATRSQTIRNFDLSGAATEKIEVQLGTAGATSGGVTNVVDYKGSAEVSYTMTGGYTVGLLAKSIRDAVTNDDNATVGNVTWYLDSSALPKKVTARVANGATGAGAAPNEPAQPVGFTGITGYSGADANSDHDGWTFAYDANDIAAESNVGHDFVFTITGNAGTYANIDSNSRIRFYMNNSDQNYAVAERWGNTWVFVVEKVTGDMVFLELTNTGSDGTLRVKVGDNADDFNNGTMIDEKKAGHSTGGISTSNTIRVGSSVTIEAPETLKTNPKAEFVGWKFSTNGTSEAELENVDASSAKTTINEMPTTLYAEALYGYKVTLPKDQPVDYYLHYGEDGQEKVEEFYVYTKASWMPGLNSGTPINLNTGLVAIPRDEYAIKADYFFLFNGDSKWTGNTPTATTDGKGVKFTFAGNSISDPRTLDSINTLDGPHKVTFDAPEGVTFTSPNGSATYAREFTIPRTDKEGGADEFTFKVNVDESKFETPINYTVTYTVGDKTVTMVARTDPSDKTKDGSYIISKLAEVDAALTGITIKVDGLTPISSGNIFDDVTDTTVSKESKEAIEWAAENGIVNGRDGKIFDPKGEATRAEFVTMLGRYEDKAASATTTKFTDIDTHWAKNNIIWAENHDPFITNGLTDTEFGPDAKITRAQTLTMIHRYAGKPAATAESKFTDLTADWYKAAINWGVEKEITVGTNTEGTTFTPDQNVTREQIALFLYRAHKAGAITGAVAADDASSDSAATDSTASDSSSEASAE